MFLLDTTDNHVWLLWASCFSADGRLKQFFPPGTSFTKTFAKQQKLSSDSHQDLIRKTCSQETLETRKLNQNDWFKHTGLHGTQESCYQVMGRWFVLAYKLLDVAPTPSTNIELHYWSYTTLVSLHVLWIYRLTPWAWGLYGTVRCRL